MRSGAGIVNIDIGSMVGGGLGLTLAITAISIVLTIVIIFVSVRWSRKFYGRDKATMELLQTGVPAMARIAQIQETNMRINNMPVLNVLLEVYPQNGQPPFQAWVQRRIPYYQMAQFQLGGTIPVRFDPANPTRVAIAM